jgi:hypothetical protein
MTDDDDLRVEPRRPSVEERIREYWDPASPTYQRGLSEAKALLDVGAPVEEAAEYLGWSVPQLLRALPTEFSAKPRETAA